MPSDSSTSTAKIRYSWPDNAKFFLIVLVVFGHLIQPLMNAPGFDAIYRAVYVFHMPAFLLMAGMFTKLSGPGYYKKIVFELVIPFLIFSVLYKIFKNYYSEEMGNTWFLWFIYTLCIWRAVLPAVDKIKIPRWAIIGLFIAFSMGVSSLGYNGRMLGISRIVVFFPFFLIGFYYKDEILKFYSPKRILPAALIFLAGLIFTLASLKLFPATLLWGTHPFPHIKEMEFWQAVFMRLFLYGFSTVMGLAFIWAMPNNKSLITLWGSRTLYIYFWHGFVVFFFYSLAVFDAMAAQPYMIAAAEFMLISIVTSAALAYFPRIGHADFYKRIMK